MLTSNLLLKQFNTHTVNSGEIAEFPLYLIECGEKPACVFINKHACVPWKTVDSDFVNVPILDICGVGNTPSESELDLLMKLEKDASVLFYYSAKESNREVIKGQTLDLIKKEMLSKHNSNADLNGLKAKNFSLYPYLNMLIGIPDYFKRQGYAVFITEGSVYNRQNQADGTWLCEAKYGLSIFDVQNNGLVLGELGC